MSLQSTQKLPVFVISAEAPFHKDRKGYLLFVGEGESKGIAVLSDFIDPENLFAVKEKYLLKSS